jgi:hypothetical protein
MIPRTEVKFSFKDILRDEHKIEDDSLEAYIYMTSTYLRIIKGMLLYILKRGRS